MSVPHSACERILTIGLGSLTTRHYQYFGVPEAENHGYRRKARMQGGVIYGGKDKARTHLSHSATLQTKLKYMGPLGCGEGPTFQSCVPCSTLLPGLKNPPYQRPFDFLVKFVLVRPNVRRSEHSKSRHTKETFELYIAVSSVDNVDNINERDRSGYWGESIRLEVSNVSNQCH